MDPLTRKKRDYLRRVRRCLTLPRPEKKRLLDTARQAVDAFVEENPQADDALWRSALGTPEELAAQLMEPYDLDEVNVALRKHTRMIRIACILFLAFVVIGGIIGRYCWINRDYVEVITYEYTIEDGDPLPLPTFHVYYEIAEDKKG